MKQDVVTVLDLGSSKITCLVAALGSRGEVSALSVATAPSAGMRRGAILDPNSLAQAISGVLRSVGAEHEGQDLGPLIVAVGGPRVDGFDAQGMKPLYPAGRLITHQDVLEVVNHSRSIGLAPGREQLQAVPRVFRIDGQEGVHQPIGMCGGRLEVTTFLVAGDREHIEAVENAVALSGARIGQMVGQSLASGLGVLTSQELDLGALVIDIGSGTTHIGGFTQGSIAFASALPVGSQLVTNDIANLLRTSPEEAERLKILHGSAVAKIVSERDSVDVLQSDHSVSRPMQRRVLCEIIESRMREIAQLVSDELERSGKREEYRSGLVLTGGGSLLPGTEILFEEILKLGKFRTAEPVALANLPTTPGLAVVAGLAQFAIRCHEDLSPATNSPDWRTKVRSLFSLVLGKGD